MAEPFRKMPADLEAGFPSPDADPFRYGWRMACVRLPSGEETEQQLPLTPDDLLDPQPGDVVGQSGPHLDLLLLLLNLLRNFFLSREDVLVAGDMKMLWGLPTLKEPAPDVAVIPGVRDKHAERESFNVLAEGTRPCLIIEVVSSKFPEIRRNDTEKKVEIYQKAGIPEYFHFDPPTAHTQGRLLLTGYRLDSLGRYRRIEPDREGRLLSQTTGLLFGVAEDGRMLLVLNAATGERLLAPAEEAREAQAEVARLREEIERLRRRL